MVFMLNHPRNRSLIITVCKRFRILCVLFTKYFEFYMARLIVVCQNEILHFSSLSFKNLNYDITDECKQNAVKLLT